MATKQVRTLTLLGREDIYAEPGRLPELRSDGSVVFNPGPTPWYVYAVHRSTPFAKRENVTYLGDFEADDTVFEAYAEELWYG